MKKRMTAVIAGDGTLRCVKEEIPELKEHEVLVKVHASLISPGTEMAAAKKRRENPDEKAEAIRFGYSNAGEIIKVRGDVKGLKVGMRVAAMGAGMALHSNYACAPVNLVAVSYTHLTLPTTELV